LADDGWWQSWCGDIGSPFKKRFAVLACLILFEIMLLISCPKHVWSG
jgi:hypothetical protein